MNLSLYGFMCFVLSNISLKFCLFFLLLFTFQRRESYSEETPHKYHKSLTSISSLLVWLPCLHTCCSSSFLEHPPGPRNRIKAWHCHFTKVLITVKPWGPGILLVLFIFIPTEFFSCFYKSQINLETFLVWVWLSITINNYFRYFSWFLITMPVAPIIVLMELYGMWQKHILCKWSCEITKLDL